MLVPVRIVADIRRTIVSESHPSLRTMFARVLTSAGWIQGDFHIPDGQDFPSYLEHGGPLYKLTRAIMPGKAVTVPFLGLRRDHVLLVVPPLTPEELGLERSEPDRRHRVCLLFENGTLSGDLAIPGQQRVSDFLMLHSGFVPLTSCESPAAKPSFRAPLGLVNTSRLIAVTEDTGR
jgi:hypothetical protein